MVAAPEEVGRVTQATNSVLAEMNGFLAAVRGDGPLPDSAPIFRMISPVVPTGTLEGQASHRAHSELAMQNALKSAVRGSASLIGAYDRRRLMLLDQARVNQTMQVAIQAIRDALGVGGMGYSIPRAELRGARRFRERSTV